MIARMFRFEWRYFTHQPSFYIIALIFFTIAFLATSLNQLGMGGGNILKNGPFVIGQIMVTLGIFSMFLVVNFVANTAMRDQTTGMAEILYCKPVNPVTYQLGRFLGSFAVVVSVFSVVPFGLLLGSLMPWVTESRIGPFRLSYYVTTFFYLSVPTLFVFSCIFYSLATRLKSMMAVYLAVIAVVIFFEVSDSMFNSPETRALAALLDPFAARTFAEVTQYWTVFEKNHLLLPFNGSLLINRLIWVGIGLLVMWFFGGFSRSLTLAKIKSAKERFIFAKKDKQTSAESEETFPLTLPYKRFTDKRLLHQDQVNASWHHLIVRTLFEVRQVIFDPAFFILCSFIFFLLVAVMFEPMGMFGSSYLPITLRMVELISNAMGVLSLIIITYYSAEVVWREDTTGMGDIIDSTPVFNLGFWLSKLVAVWLVLVLLLIFSMAVTIIFQLASGYHRLELSQYFVSLMYFSALPWMMLTVLAFFLQVISPNKYIGMSLFVLFILSGLVMEPLGLGHNMYRFSRSPALIYSDMNGYGGALISHSWYMLYWGALSVAMSIVGYGLWQRGPYKNLIPRIRALGYQLGRAGKWALLGSCLVFVISASIIFYNTRVLNHYRTTQQMNEQRAEYEKHYAEFIDDPVPTIVEINAAVDIFPARRRVEAVAQIVVKNRTLHPIKRFLVSVPGYHPLRLSVEIEGGELGAIDGELNSRWFEFDKVLQPGESRSGQYSVVRQQQGFADKDETIQLVENGTFFNNTELFPGFGYQQSLELLDREQRLKWELPPARRAHKLEDSRYYQQTILGPQSGYLDFEATVSTSIDQIAIAPGYLQREWTEDGRRYFHYKMDAPIKNYFAFLSARFEVLRTRHAGIDIEIFYHPDHSYNVQRMQEAVKDSIDYFSKNFGPYQHRQARIIEFPGYRNFAQSFPNTIAYSERIGFITDLRDPEIVDSVYYVTAHEMAHQWWGGQVDGANVQGSTMIVETLAQYSALMLTKQKYGQVKLRTILKFELDRYLRERTRELVEELPLMRVENQQYIHYRKGSVAMMSLVDLLGEERMNRVLRNFLEEFKFSQSRYPTTLDLLAHINRETSETEQNFVRNIFEQISLYDLKAVDVDVLQTSDDQFEITFIVDAHRVNADGQGRETEAPLSEYIDIGLFAENPDDLSIMGGGVTGNADNRTMYLQKHLITDGENTIKISLPDRPQWAGIDPFVKLIDRDSTDNTIRIRPKRSGIAAADL